MSHYPIDHQSLKRAAEALLVIDEAGYGEQFDRELLEMTSGDHQFRVDQSNLAHQIDYGWVAEFTKRLVRTFDCPTDSALIVAIELSGARTKRSAAMELAPRMAGEVRRVQSQAARQRMQGRRSA